MKCTGLAFPLQDDRWKDGIQCIYYIVIIMFCDLPNHTDTYSDFTTIDIMQNRWLYCEHNRTICVSIKYSGYRNPVDFVITERYRSLSDPGALFVITTGLVRDDTIPTRYIAATTAIGKFASPPGFSVKSISNSQLYHNNT